jgi:hypothetical protein
MHAQNNGFAFVERLIDERPDGLRLFNSDEVEGSPGLVVTFVTKASTKDTVRLKGKQERVDINRAAKLDGIILGIRATSSRSGVRPSARAGTTNPYAVPPPARWPWVWQLPSQ